MAVASCIPSFKAALVTRLDAATDASTIVSYGIPISLTDANDWVWVGNAQGADPIGDVGGGQRTAAMGRKRQEERWVQDIVVSVLRSVSESQQTVTERAFTIAATIEDSIRTWTASVPAYSGYTPPTGADFHWAVVVSTDLEEFINPEERGAQITIGVACAART